MKLMNVALNSISRRKRRAFLVMLGITFSVAIMISITGVTMSYTKIIESSFRPYSGKIVVTHSSARFFEAMPSQSILEPELESTIEEVEGVARVAPVAMRTYGGAESLIPSILVGLRAKDHYFIYPQLIVLKGDWPRQAGEVVLGMASPFYLEGARQGDVISLYGINMTVSGVLFPTDIRIFNSYLIVDLDFYYNLTRTRFVSLFLIQPEVSSSQEVVADRIEAVVPYVNALTDKSQAALVDNIVDKVQRWNSYIGMIAALMSICLITTIQYLTVIQRQRELGTMKAIGASNGIMIRLILLESTVVGMFGCILGIVVGFIGALGIVYLYNRGNDLLVILHLTAELLSWQSMLIAFFAGLVVAVASAILPLKRVLSLDPIASISNPEV